MASPKSDQQSDWSNLLSFTKVLTLKIAQIVVQSRKGNKITQESNINVSSHSTASQSQLFNLSIPDDQEVLSDMNGILNGEIAEALSKAVTIEISLRTSEDEEMVLEYWTTRLTPAKDQSSKSISTIHDRMSTILKSTLCISRMTPAYKISRAQSNESYKVLHRIYEGLPDFEELGEGRKTIKVSELSTPIGTILVEVVYRLKMAIPPNSKVKHTDDIAQAAPSNSAMMMTSNHFSPENQRKASEKGEVNLTVPLRAGAFVDTNKIKELRDTLSQKLPPEPPMTWLLSEKEKLESKGPSEGVDIAKPGSTEMTSYSAPTTASKPIEVPKAKNTDNQYNSLMNFPFADGSPLTDLANFYNECLKARSVSDEWTELLGDVSVSTDSESLSHQLKMYEDAVPEFDTMVASMYSNAEQEDN